MINSLSEKVFETSKLLIEIYFGSLIDINHIYLIYILINHINLFYILKDK